LAFFTASGLLYKSTAVPAIVVAGGMSIGMKGMMNAAITIAGTAVDLYNNPEAVKNAKKELIERRGQTFNYYSLLGDREPPLDYRK
jgi:aminobenzoyl-glutamate utilization protein B